MGQRLPFSVNLRLSLHQQRQLLKSVLKKAAGGRGGINHCKDIRSKVNKLLPAPPVFGDAGAAAAAATCTILHAGSGFGLLGWDGVGAVVNK